ncbi:MAG: hypothetical protein M1837_002527 [Sclerophora amabilis]|nr:MAG: hypothetical protein M1837_002527 [Sclerophora amabilis]
MLLKPGTALPAFVVLLTLASRQVSIEDAPNTKKLTVEIALRVRDVDQTEGSLGCSTHGCRQEQRKSIESKRVFPRGRYRTATGYEYDSDDEIVPGGKENHTPIDEYGEPRVPYKADSDDSDDDDSDDEQLEDVKSKAPEPKAPEPKDAVPKDDEPAEEIWTNYPAGALTHSEEFENQFQDYRFGRPRDSVADRADLEDLADKVQEWFNNFDPESFKENQYEELLITYGGAAGPIVDSVVVFYEVFNDGRTPTGWDTDEGDQLPEFLKDKLLGGYSSARMVIDLSPATGRAWLPFRNRQGSFSCAAGFYFVASAPDRPSTPEKFKEQEEAEDSVEEIENEVVTLWEVDTVPFSPGEWEKFREQEISLDTGRISMKESRMDLAYQVETWFDEVTFAKDDFEILNYGEDRVVVYYMSDQETSVVESECPDSWEVDGFARKVPVLFADWIEDEEMSSSVSRTIGQVTWQAGFYTQGSW